MKVDHIYVSDDTAIVDMTSTFFAPNERPYAQRYCWITRFVDGLIVEVRAYLDSVLSIRMPRIECYKQRSPTFDLQASNYIDLYIVVFFVQRTY